MNEVSSFNFNFIKDSDIVSYISNSEYISAMEKLLQLCIRLEKYELCKDIHNELKLIKLKEVRKKPKKVTVSNP